MNNDAFSPFFSTPSSDNSGAPVGEEVRESYLGIIEETIPEEPHDDFELREEPKVEEPFGPEDFDENGFFRRDFPTTLRIVSDPDGPCITGQDPEVNGILLEKPSDAGIALKEAQSG